MIIYAISGLGADKRTFQKLKINYPVVYLDWIPPLVDESIEAYSLRLAGEINTTEPFAIMGVSFGGLIATEISKKLNPKLTILISSAEIRTELYWLFRLMGKSNIMRHAPAEKMQISKPIAHYFFQTKHTKLLDQILDDTDLVFSKWAVQELMKWKNKDRINNCVKISGTKDRVMPHTSDEKTVSLVGGGHFMIVDRADEISEIINTKMDCISL